MLSHVSLSDDCVHAAVLRKQRLIRNDPKLGTQSGDGRLSDAFFIDSTKVVTVQWNHFLARKNKNVFDLETATASSTTVSASILIELEYFFREMLRKGSCRNPLCTWYASDVVLLDHRPGERHLKKRNERRSRFFRAKEEKVSSDRIFQ